MSMINYDSGPLIVSGTGATNDLHNVGVGTFTSKDLDNFFRKGIKLTGNISAISGGASVLVSIEGKDPVSGQYTTILVSAAKTGTGAFTLTVYPGIAASANVSASDILPKTWRVKVVVSVAGNVTMTLGAAVLV